MHSAAGAWRSTVGLKLLMAVTGILLILFLVAHLLGNLLVFQGREAMNAYAASLHAIPRLLWVARIGLLVVFVTHVWASIQLSRRNRAARPAGYARRRWLRTSLASRAMLVSGIVVFLYLVFHLLHFTLGVLQPSTFAAQLPQDANGHLDVYGMVVQAFEQPVFVVVYVAAVVLLAMHLSHAATSFFQTLGLSHPRYDRFFRGFGPVLATILAIGYIAIPLAVVAGLVHA